MKNNSIAKYLPLGLLLVCSLWLIGSLFRAQPKSGEHDWKSFAELPVLLNGRVKPLDTIARNSLLILSGKTTLTVDKKTFGDSLDDLFSDGRRKYTMPAIEWFANVVFQDPRADKLPVFRIQNKELLELLEQEGSEKGNKRCTYSELQPHLPKLQKQAPKARKVEAELRTAFQKAVVNLDRQFALYIRLKTSVRFPQMTSYKTEIANLRKFLPMGIAAARRMEQKTTIEQDGPVLQALAGVIERYKQLGEYAYFFSIPVKDPPSKDKRWQKIFQAILTGAQTPALNPVAQAYTEMSDAWLDKDSAAFNKALANASAWIKKERPDEAAGAAREVVFNHYKPFSKCRVLYVLIFILVCVSWLGWGKVLGKTAFYLLLLTLTVHTGGLIARMLIENRPPVTNLYSSAVFIGWGACLLGVILEFFFRHGIGNAVASLTGFSTLLVAHYLSLDGDTMEMMRAVLDSNFWLATHVIIVTLGYSSTFVAGFLAVIFIFLGMCTPLLTPEISRALNRMVYGIICFSTLFSFTGTVLGGIWADQSWGRFWGWDPKENGALLIVIWNALILHARWGGMIKTRGLMILAVGGNIITSWSWFGTNMLAVGLHTYGFMDAASLPLILFVALNFLLMLVALVPFRYWLSGRKGQNAKKEKLRSTPA